MRVLVTGAAGFVGSRLVRVLVAEGCEVTALVRDSGPRLEDLGAEQLSVVRGDLTAGAPLEALVTRIAPELCIHCAWYAVPGEYLSSPENVVHRRAALSLGRALAAAGCRRLVGVGTCFEYAASDDALSEESPVGPLTPYAESKLAVSRELAELSAETGMEFSWARLFYLFGPFEDPRRLVPSVVLSLLAGEAARTTAGDQLRDFLYVDDVAEALWAVARSPVSGPVNIGSGTPTAVREIVLAIGEIVGRPELIELGALPSAPVDPPVIVADNRRLVESTGWQPRYDLNTGLTEAVAWWKERVTP